MLDPTRKSVWARKRPRQSLARETNFETTIHSLISWFKLSAIGLWNCGLSYWRAEFVERFVIINCCESFYYLLKGVSGFFRRGRPRVSTGQLLYVTSLDTEPRATTRLTHQLAIIWRAPRLDKALSRLARSIPSRGAARRTDGRTDGGGES